MHNALSNDDEVRAYVEELEANADSQPDVMYRSGDLADEIEAFLRDQR